MILNYRSIGELLIETEGISDKSSLEYKRFIWGVSVRSWSNTKKPTRMVE